MERRPRLGGHYDDEGQGQGESQHEDRQHRQRGAHPQDVERNHGSCGQLPTEAEGDRLGYDAIFLPNLLFMRARPPLAERKSLTPKTLGLSFAQHTDVKMDEKGIHEYKISLDRLRRRKADLEKRIKDNKEFVVSPGGLARADRPSARIALTPLSSPLRHLPPAEILPRRHWPFRQEVQDPRRGDLAAVRRGQGETRPRNQALDQGLCLPPGLQAVGRQLHQHPLQA